jgi:hypothetical protein
MKSKDYIPAAVATFNQWQKVLVAYVVANAERFGLIPEDLAPLQAKQAAWEAAYAVADNPATRTKAANDAKKEACTTYKKEIRPFVKANLTYSRKVSDADRSNMGLPIHDTKPTRASIPNTRPEVEVKFEQQLEHEVRVNDTVQSGSGKPEHVTGFEIYRQVVGLDAPQPSIEQMQLVVMAPRSPHKLTYSSAEQGKRVYYAVRWVNTRGEAGPWSAIVSAIVA